MVSDYLGRDPWFALPNQKDKDPPNTVFIVASSKLCGFHVQFPIFCIYLVLSFWKIELCKRPNHKV